MHGALKLFIFVQLLAKIVAQMHFHPLELPTHLHALAEVLPMHTDSRCDAAAGPTRATHAFTAEGDPKVTTGAASACFSSPGST